MGCRAYIIVKHEKPEVPDIYLYTHWGCIDLPSITQQFLCTPDVERLSSGYFVGKLFKALVARSDDEDVAIDLKEDVCMDLVEGVIEVHRNRLREITIKAFGNCPVKFIREWTLAEYITTPLQELKNTWIAGIYD